MKYEKLSLNQIKENILKNIGMKKFILIIAALILLVLGFVPQNKTASSKGASDGTEYEAQGGVYDYEEYTEKRLEEFIGSISGSATINASIMPANIFTCFLHVLPGITATNISVIM